MERTEKEKIHDQALENEWLLLLVGGVCVPSQEVRKWISPPRQDRFDEKKTTEDGTSLKRPFTALECDGKRTKGEERGRRGGEGQLLCLPVSVFFFFFFTCPQCLSTTTALATFIWVAPSSILMTVATVHSVILSCTLSLSLFLPLSSTLFFSAGGEMFE